MKRLDWKKFELKKEIFLACQSNDLRKRKETEESRKKCVELIENIGLKLFRKDKELHEIFDEFEKRGDGGEKVNPFMVFTKPKDNKNTPKRHKKSVFSVIRVSKERKNTTFD